MTRTLSSKPGLYELGLRVPGTQEERFVYLGSAAKLSSRVPAYLRGAHIRALVDWHLAWGWHIVVHVKKCSSAQAAQRRESDELDVTNYEWNTRQSDPELVLYPARFHPDWRDTSASRKRQLEIVRAWLGQDRKLRTRRLPAIRIAKSWPGT
ncbi:MAG: hypothetical protein KDB90_04550 [Planctomycetes bacterium]|nr:hypothetical protein [Planctomycetota bacterium]